LGTSSRQMPSTILNHDKSRTLFLPMLNHSN
jgi:hypothetical protein